MSDYDNSDAYYDSSASIGEDDLDVWTIATTRQEAVEAIAERIATMQRLYRETIALAAEFDVNVSFALESDQNRGHNRDEWISWNSSSQYC